MTMHLNILNLYLLKYANFLHYVQYGQYKCHQQIVYQSQVWDICGQTNCNCLEKIQIEAARIATGLSIYASFDSIYKESVSNSTIQRIPCLNQ
jgi:hypothetical protein